MDPKDININKNAGGSQHWNKTGTFTIRYKIVPMLIISVLIVSYATIRMLIVSGNNLAQWCTV